MSQPISALGEFGLVRHLTGDIRPRHPSTVRGIGDDAAILRFGNATLAVTTDTMAEGIHFDLSYTPMQHLGYKAAVLAFSDLYAMNAVPRQLMVSVAVSAKFSVESMELLYQGLKHACDYYEADLVGGDTSPSITGLYISVTAVGEAVPERITYRNTAQKGDLICVSGDLGAAYMGLQVLEREKKLFKEDAGIRPQLEGYEYVIGKYLRPEARKDIFRFLSSAGLTPTAMIDISDGLSSDLLQICCASKTGCEIHCHKIPIAEPTVRTAGEFYMEPLIAALNGGDDYELLFTLPVNDYDKLIGHPEISIIGYVTAPEEGCCLVPEHGDKIELKGMGTGEQVDTD
ncbi:MAG: thiamine-phosphate kinase [Bacteroidales bacterium]|jgi:thiamine-monophosphate kinase|nr:thiamine-phosphate kinase [Bacteroidales bacterium]